MIHFGTLRNLGRKDFPHVRIHRQTPCTVEQRSLESAPVLILYMTCSCNARLYYIMLQGCFKNHDSCFHDPFKWVILSTTEHLNFFEFRDEIICLIRKQGDTFCRILGSFVYTLTGSTSARMRVTNVKFGYNGNTFGWYVGG
jgi:hypothetical protein